MFSWRLSAWIQSQLTCNIHPFLTPAIFLGASPSNRMQSLVCPVRAAETRSHHFGTWDWIGVEGEGSKNDGLDGNIDQVSVSKKPFMSHVIKAAPWPCDPPPWNQIMAGRLIAFSMLFSKIFFWFIFNYLKKIYLVLVYIRLRLPTPASK